MLAGVAALLVLAVIAGLVALEQRGRPRARGDRGRRAAARRARSRRERAWTARCCWRARAWRSTTRSQTRGNLLAALLKSPAAIGVLRGRPARASSASRSARTSARSPSATTAATSRSTTRARGAGWPRSSLASTGPPAPTTAAPTRWHTAPTADGWPSRKGKYRTSASPCSTRAPGELPLGWTSRAGGDVVALRYSLRRADARRRAQRLLDPTVRARPPRSAHGPTTRPAGGYRPRPTDSRRQDRQLACQRHERRAPAGRGRAGRDDRARCRERAQPAPHPRRRRPRHRVRAQPRRPHARGRRGRRLAAPGATCGSGETRTAAGPHGAAVDTIAFTPDGRTVITGDVDGEITGWDVRRAEVIETLHRPRRRGARLRRHERRSDALQRRPRPQRLRMGPRRRTPPRAPVPRRLAQPVQPPLRPERRRPPDRDRAARRRGQRGRRAHADPAPAVPRRHDPLPADSRNRFRARQPPPGRG